MLATGGPHPYLYQLLVELSQHMLPHRLLHEDTEICVGEPATPHALLFCHTAGKQNHTKPKRGMVDVAWSFLIKEASVKVGLEKALLKVCRRELQSLAKACRYLSLLFHCSRASSEQSQSQGCSPPSHTPTVLPASSALQTVPGDLCRDSSPAGDSRERSVQATQHPHTFFCIP